MTVSEYLKSKEHDLEYIKMREREEQELQKRNEAFVIESIPYVQDCSRFDYNIKTAWGLANAKSINPELIPIMIKYLSDLSYSDRFRECIARSLDVPEAMPYFKDVLNIFNKENNDSKVKWVIGHALSLLAKKQDEVDIIEKMIYDKKLGINRSPFLHTVKKQMKGEQLERVLVFAREDPELKINLKVNRLK